MKIPFNKKWIVLEREDYANYLFLAGSWEGFTILPKQWGFPLIHWLSAEYIDSATNAFITLDDYEKESASYFEMVFTKPEHWNKLHHNMQRYSDELMRVSRAIKRLNARQLSNKQLLLLRLKFEKYHRLAHVPRGIMFMVEMVESKLTNYMHEYLSERIADFNLKGITPFYAFQILTTSRQQSLLGRERERLIKISLIQNKEKQEQALKCHAAEYAWIEYGLQGKILGLDHFQHELANIKRRHPAKLLAKIKQDLAELKKKQQELLKSFKVHGQHRALLKIASDAIFYKAYSKDAQFFGYWCIEPLLREIGRRGGLTLEQVRFLAIPDYSAVLLKGKDLSELANERMKYSLHFSDKGQTVFYAGEAARKIRKKLKFVASTEKVKAGETIKGQPAFSGRARGKVKIINTPQEMLKMHQGDVLVSHMTNPDIVPAMKKASAIVTDLGGITCHAAIISRELGIPCIIGTRVATSVLKDGDRVEVDAERGIVKKLG